MEHFSHVYTEVQFYPTDAQPECLKALEAVHERNDRNVHKPCHLNITADEQWKDFTQTHGSSFNIVLAFNLIHLIPWEATTDHLLPEAAKVLDERHGYLILHGAFKRNNAFQSESDKAFDEDIRTRNVLWGLRDVEQLERVASHHGLSLAKIIDMPKGNLLIAFKSF